MVSEGVPFTDQQKAAELMPAPAKKAKPAVPLFSANGTSSKAPSSGESLPQPGASQFAASIALSLQHYIAVAPDLLLIPSADAARAAAAAVAAKAAQRAAHLTPAQRERFINDAAAQVTSLS